MGQTTANIGIYVPSQGETNYAASFAVGMSYVDNHDHSGPPHGGVQLTGTGIADHSVTGVKLNSNVVDGLSIQYTGSNAVASIKASGAQAIAGTDINVSITPSVLPTVFASPFAIGGTAPSTGAFTSLSATVTDASTSSQTTVLTLTHKTSGTAANSIGVAEDFVHQQANGTLVTGARVLTSCPNAGTNVQTTNLSVQTNVAGALTTQLTFTNTAANFQQDIVAAVAGKGVQIKEGANARMGVATLVAGTITIANTSVTANTRVIAFRSAVNASTAVGAISQGTLTPATSFVINARKSDATVETNDVSTVNWLLFEPSP